MTTQISIEPITQRSFSEYGDLITTDGATNPIPVNQGRGRKYAMPSHFTGKDTSIQATRSSLYSISPSTLPFILTLMEKHPHSTQLFIPMAAADFLVIVSQGDDRPDLGTVKAFMARPDQGIHYKQGIWHAPLAVINGTSTFYCHTFDLDDGKDTVEYRLTPQEIISVS